ncbi:Structural maintenance of chromosomes protein 1 [Friedmanniomyces endolithicus]|nr:Structural maintenance of chromosomes protein 1 [Friedmanniomyces endolithicus]
MQQEAEQKKREFEKQINRLNNQLSFETQRLAKTEQTLHAVEVQVQRDEERVAQLEGEKEAISGEIDVLHAEIKQINEALATLREQYTERGDKVNDARREVQKRSKCVEKTLKEVAALEAEVQKASTGRYGELKECKLKNIDLPLEKGSRKLDALHTSRPTASAFLPCAWWSFCIASTLHTTTGATPRAPHTLPPPPDYPIFAMGRSCLLTRSDVFALIADGGKIVIKDDAVLRLDGWLEKHPGGRLAILHMVGRDATDELNM